MLYSEIKERQSRFITALKIGFPFLVLIVGYMSFFEAFEKKDNNFFLLLAAVIVYVYYVLYMIYKGFRTTLKDSYSSAFNADGILKELKKHINKTDKKNKYVCMLVIKNISDIESQYGVLTKNIVIDKFVQILNSYLLLKGYKKIPIGRLQASNFLLLFQNIKNKRNLEHIMRTFIKEIENIGIDTIEIQPSFSTIELSYDNNLKNIILKLFNLLENDNSKENLSINAKPDELDDVIKVAVEFKNFMFTYQKICNFNKDEDKIFYQVNTKIPTHYFGILARNQYMSSVFKNGYEVRFDKNSFSALLEEAKFWLYKNENAILFVRISAVSFRNRGFLIHVIERLKEHEISAKNICFTMVERNIYDNFSRFKEIIKEYKSLGFLVAFDEFGANNSGAEYIKQQIEFDIVLFDIEYTKNIDKKIYFELLKAMIIFCKSIDIKTAIKFIDKKKIVEALKDCKPDYVQGFLYGKPKSIDEI